MSYSLLSIQMQPHYATLPSNVCQHCIGTLEGRKGKTRQLNDKPEFGLRSYNVVQDMGCKKSMQSAAKS